MDHTTRDRRLKAFSAMCLVLLLTAGCSEEDKPATTQAKGTTGNGTAVTPGAGPVTPPVPGTPVANGKSPTTAALDSLKPIPPRSESRQRYKTTQTPATMADFMTLVINDVHLYWVNSYRSWGFADPTVRYQWLGQGAKAEAGCRAVVADENSAFYCSETDGIFFGTTASTKFANQAGGDFPVVYVIAHEYGHNVQHEFGWYNGNVPTWKMELEADCLAGTFANWAYYQNKLNDGDISEAIRLAALIGDFNYDHPGHHGTPEQRVEAFKLGYNSGSVKQCHGYEA